MKLHRLLTLLATLSALAALKPSPLAACSCDFASVEWLLERSACVFRGVVVRVEHPGLRTVVRDGESTLVWDPGVLIRNSLTPTASWKGDLPDTVTIHALDVETACGVRFEVGKEYLVFAMAVRDTHTYWGKWPDDTVFPVLATTRCHRSAEVSRAKDALADLGKPAWKPDPSHQND